MYLAQFHNELKNSLPESSGADRKMWATKIIQDNLSIKDLSELLNYEKKVASRFSWLLSDIGLLNPNKLFGQLPYLFELSNQIDHINFKQSFATYWLISGIPLENEAKAIDLLFNWIRSSDTNVTTKSRSLYVLFDIAQKYPDLKNELRITLKNQLDKNTKEFRKRAIKLLKKLEQ
jgi:hypothetical protein